MKILFLFILIIFFSSSLFSKNLFNTSFNKVEFVSSDIKNEKIKIIKKIKLKSISKILNNILIKEEYQKVSENLTGDIINMFVKNVIINEEKIINDKYFSTIKINFDKKKIIEYLRSQKISYVEYFPKNILLIISEETELNSNLFTINNNFYSYLKKNLQSYELLKIPNLDINDRFMLNNEDLRKKDVKKIKMFSEKYNLSDIAIIFISNSDNELQYETNFYSNNNVFENKSLFNNNNYDKFFKNLQLELIDTWKKLNLIQNNNLNYLNCNLNFLNLHELREIRNNLINVSLIKNFEVKSVQSNNIEYDIFYFGNYKILIEIMSLNKLKINNQNNSCTIKLQ